MYVHSPVSQTVCITVAFPVGFHFASNFIFTRRVAVLASPVMADCSSQPPVSEIVARADEYYDHNKMKEGLKYMAQYEHLDEVEVGDSVAHEVINVFIS